MAFARLGRGKNASGAVLAQLVQALASFVVQVIAVRDLGADGFGIFALLYSGLVLGTAVSTGLVGDSLTVLDRTDPTIRAGLKITGVGVALIASAVSVPIVVFTGLLSPLEAAVFALVVLVFILEELLRRLLMASMKFWSVVTVDATALVGALLPIVAFRLLGGQLSMVQLLLALLAGQVCALLVAILLLPSNERHRGVIRGAKVDAVLRYGGWRAAQQSVRPAMLTLMRSIVVIAAGVTLFGELEAARVYTAPAMLLVNGIGGYLFATYAARKHSSLSSLIKKADEGAVSLVLLTLLLGGLAVLLEPWAGQLITDGKFELSSVAVFGWSVYAAASATLMPYASLGAVRGRHAIVLGMRLVEAVVSLGALVVVLLVLDLDISWAPYSVAFGAVVCGGAVRQLILVPQAREEDRSISDAARTAP